jgi:transposase-like protein
MKSTFKTDEQREAIVAEYLLGGGSFRFLGKKHDIDFRAIHSWVMKFKGNEKAKIKKAPSADCLLSPGAPPLPTDVKQLKDELRKVKLHNELLNTMIDIAESELKIDIRKKSGTKR